MERKGILLYGVIIILSLNLLLSCKEKKTNPDKITPVVFSFQSLLQTSENDKAILPTTDIYFIAVGHTHPKLGSHYFPLERGIYNGTFYIPSGENELFALLYSHGSRVTSTGAIQNYDLYFDTQRHFLRGQEISVFLQLSKIQFSPHRLKGTVTLRNESGVPVTNQKLVVDHEAYQTSPHLFEVTTNNAGQFTIDAFMRSQTYIVTVIDESGTALRKVKFQVPSYDNFYIDAQYRITEEYCQTLTQAKCNVPGCVWIKLAADTVASCHSQKNIDCVSLTENYCTQNQACFWDSTTSSCLKTYDTNCQELTQANCTGPCMWSNNTCINSTMTSCSSFITGPTCVPPCVWEEATMTCKNAALSSCAGYLTSPTCITDSACLWDNTLSVCKNKLASDCSGYTTANTCLADAACFWNNTDSFCQNALSISCGDMTTPTECNNDPACIWDAAGNFCKNASAIDCFSYTQAICSTVTGCFWDNASATCQNAMSTDCGQYITSATCQVQTSCFWDNTDSLCKRVLGTDCASYVTDATCLSDSACTWDMSVTPPMCINKLTIDCASLDATDCANSNNCIYDPVANVCLNAGTIDCNAHNTSADCAASAGCVWDFTNNFCKNSTNVSCADFTQAECVNEPACFWDPAAAAGTPACKSNTSTNCASFITDATCMTTHGCFWRMASNTCLNGITFDCQQYNGTPAMCAGAPPCFWHIGTSRCYNKMNFDCTPFSATQTLCENYKGCFFGGGGCKNAFAINCNFPTQAECDGMKPDCFWDSGYCKKSVREGCLSAHDQSTLCLGGFGAQSCTFQGNGFCTPNP